jgi:formate dehydrogenase subunit gamma
MNPGAMAGGSPVEQRVRTAVAAHRADRGALLPILHDLQAEFGYVDRAVVPILADELNLSRADVYGVISFYHDFTEEPRAGTVVRICRAEACQAVGAETLAEHATASLGTDIGGTSADRGVSLGQVFCFGNCALGPAVEVNGTVHGRVDAARFDALVASADPSDRRAQP